MSIWKKPMMIDWIITADRDGALDGRLMGTTTKLIKSMAQSPF
jgi:hypothetical protein